jgi:hypothetical protein
MVQARPLAAFLPEAAGGNELSRPPAELAVCIRLGRGGPRPGRRRGDFHSHFKLLLGTKDIMTSESLPEILVASGGAMAPSGMGG